MSTELEQVFESFCAFGAGKDTTPQMDGAKFGKFFRDLKLLDKKLTATDVDIVFAKAKAKTERKIAFEQFVTALRMCAEIKYPKDAGAMRKLESKIVEGKGPVTANPVQTSNKSTVDRLTDTSKYTGAHKHRFDDSGKGRGLAGRDHPAKGAGMSPGSVGSQASYVSGYKNQDTYGKK